MPRAESLLMSDRATEAVGVTGDRPRLDRRVRGPGRLRPGRRLHRLRRGRRVRGPDRLRPGRRLHRLRRVRRVRLPERREHSGTQSGPRPNRCRIQQDWSVCLTARRAPQGEVHPTPGRNRRSPHLGATSAGDPARLSEIRRCPTLRPTFFGRWLNVTRGRPIEKGERPGVSPVKHGGKSPAVSERCGKHLSKT
jgi:hypothetical protein